MNPEQMQWSDLGQVVYIGQENRVEELNERIAVRNVPDQGLAPNFSPRPALSKYSLFPMLDNRMPSSVPIQPNYNYSLESTFTPPVMNVGPVAGFINKVAVESELRNQYFALQRGGGQNVYIPSSTSDLYQVMLAAPSKPVPQPFPGLFETAQFDQSVHPNLEGHTTLGRDIFHNNTRTQLRTSL